MSRSVEQIKSRLSIVDVVGQYVELKKAGIHYKGLCPFHNEKSPSFTVSPDRNTYYCFGCNAKGDVFSFVQEFEGIDFKQALQLLADKAGVDLSEDSFTPQKKIDKSLYSVMELANDFFVSQLKTHPTALEYLENRGMSLDTVSIWGVGFAPDEWRATSDFLKEKKISEEDMLKVGLIKKKEGGNGVYDVFRGRIMFPIYDNLGRLVAFTGRILEKNENAPKYLNTPETELFNKSEVLFGLDKAKSAIRKLDYVIMAEGQMDVVMSHQAGVKNTVASSGTAFTPQHLAALSSLTKRILFAFDSDEAGINAMKRSGHLALKSGFDVKVLVIKDAKDPADIVQENPELWRESIKSSVPIVDYLINTLIDQKIDERLRIKRISSDILPFISVVQSDIEKAHYIKKISEVFSINEPAIWNELQTLDTKHVQQEVYVDDIENQKKDETYTRMNGVQKRHELLAALLFIGEVNTLYFERASLIKNMIDIAGEAEVNKLIECNESERDKIIFEAEKELFVGDEEEIKISIKKNIESLLNGYQIEYIDKKLAELKQSMKFADQKGDTHESEKLLHQYNDLIEQKHRLQN